MPTPRRNETRREFVDRCMGDAEANRDFPENDVRLAFCINTFTREAGRTLPRRRR